MTLKSHIPFFTVPLAIAMLCALVAGVVWGRYGIPHDIPRFTIFCFFCIYQLVSGLIKWNKPYIMAVDNGLIVFGRWFSNQPSLVIPWSDIKRSAGRTFSTFSVELIDGPTVKIPVNGVSGSALKELLAMIESKTGKVNTSHSTLNPAHVTFHPEP